MNNLIAISPILIFCLVGMIGFGIDQWRRNRERLPQVPSGRIIRATFTVEERKSAREWM